MEILWAHEIGKNLELNLLQQEAFLLATLETIRLNTGTSLDKIHHDVLFNGQVISPSFFSILLIMLNIRDDKFDLLVKILTRSCSVMHQNADQETKNHFQSDGFYRQFININKSIDEIWMLRREEPAQMSVWKTKHKKMFQLRSKLFSFLEKLFGRAWVQNFKDMAEMDRVRV